MPLYKVTEIKTKKHRLVSAVSSSAALSHASRGMFAVETMGDPAKVAELMASGVEFEKAGEPGKADGDEDTGKSAGDEDQAKS